MAAPLSITLVMRAETERHLPRNRREKRMEVEGLFYTGREVWLGESFTGFLKKSSCN